MKSIQSIVAVVGAGVGSEACGTKAEDVELQTYVRIGSKLHVPRGNHVDAS